MGSSARKAEIERYLVVGPVRTGTTAVHLALMGHPQVSSFSDEIRPEPLFSESVRLFTHGNESEAERRAGYVTLFDALASIRADHKTRAWGLKTALGSASQAERLVPALQENFPDLKIVRTIRSDIVAQLGSLRRAQLTGHWHSWSREKRALDDKLKISDREIADHAAEYLWTERQLDQLEISHQVFEFRFEEHLLAGDDNVFPRLFEFLGLDRLEPTWLRSRKVAPGPEKFIDRYAELRKTVVSVRETFKKDPEGTLRRMRSLREKGSILRRISQKWQFRS